MKFGACVGTDEDKIKVSKEVGFDYVETNLTDITAMTDEEFETFLLFLRKIGIPCEASNCFIPGNYKLVGEIVDYKSISAYVIKALARASRVGIKLAVFGSGGARRVPDGISKEDAHKQIVYFLKEIVSPEAGKYGIMIAIEPLNKEACNCVNSVPEGVAIARATGRNNVKTLADLFHVYLENDPLDKIAALKGEIIHAHIANPVARCFPAIGDDFDYMPFISALKSAGCGRCSVEADTKDFANEAPKALARLKSL
ncbi:MAG: sugar phosphate isomerase/epimerase [Clostridiales bacterium]|nr:sugar phosphate isomerase/epimerase [Clostridiales bacterium]